MQLLGWWMGVRRRARPKTTWVAVECTDVRHTAHNISAQCDRVQVERVHDWAQEILMLMRGTWEGEEIYAPKWTCNWMRRIWIVGLLLWMYLFMIFLTDFKVWIVAETNDFASALGLHQWCAANIFLFALRAIDELTMDNSKLKENPKVGIVDKFYYGISDSLIWNNLDELCLHRHRRHWSIADAAFWCCQTPNESNVQKMSFAWWRDESRHFVRNQNHTSASAIDCIGRFFFVFENNSWPNMSNSGRLEHFENLMKNMANVTEMCDAILVAGKNNQK